LLILQKTLVEVYEKPQTPVDVSAHAGNYYGLIVYTEKMMASTIYEFFKLVEKHSNIIESSSEFNEIKNSMGRTELEIWNQIVGIATKSETYQDKDTQNFMHILYLIRNKFGFHYDCEDKHFRQAYISRFFGEMKHPSTEKAFYTFGDTLENTRFFFSDASLEEAIYLAIGKEAGKDGRNDILVKNFMDNIVETVHFISPVVATLLKQFIAHRRNLPQ